MLKGIDTAKTLTPNSKSKVGLSSNAGLVFSNALTADMCANGQKLQALCGNTTASKTAASLGKGTNSINAPLNRKVIPALKVNREVICAAGPI